MFMFVRGRVLMCLALATDRVLVAFIHDWLSLAVSLNDALRLAFLPLVRLSFFSHI